MKNPNNFSTPYNPDELHDAWQDMSQAGYGGSDSPEVQSVDETAIDTTMPPRSPMGERREKAQAAMDSHTSSGGMAAMEAAAARDLEVNAVARAEDAETTRRQEAFSDRLPAENSLAEYELFGSGNSTIRNPETGEVMADPSNPKVGLLEQMRTDRRYGKTEDDRNAYADAYEARLEGLTKDEGLELAQAKLILDLEEGDVQKRGKLIGAEITNGKTAQEAEAHVDAQLARLGQKRKELILDGGALTKEDYDTLRTGGELYPVEAEELDTIDDEPIDTETEDTPEEEVPSLEFTDEEKAAFEAARDKYAERTAKGRNSYLGGFLKKKGLVSKLLKKIPGVERVAEKLNEKVDADIEQAREEYESILEGIQDKIAEQYEAAGADDQKIHEATVGTVLGLEASFEQQVVKMRQEMSKDTNKFVNWWTRQQGFKGKLKKGAVIAGGGFAIGFAGAAIGSGLAGIAAAGAAGGWAAHHVKRRRANAVIDGKTVAERQSAQDFDTKQQKAGEVLELSLDEYDAGIDVGAFTDITEQRTDSEQYKNRKRLIGTAALAMSGARLGNMAYNFIAAPSGQEAPASNPSQETPSPENPSVTPELQGTEFTIEAGHGYTQELVDFAQANGHNLTPDQAFDLHNHLVEEFGKQYISGTDIYQQMGDIRLSNPGSASWNPGVAEAIQSWMGDKGLW